MVLAGDFPRRQQDLSPVFLTQRFQSREKVEKASEDVLAAANALRTVRPGGHRSSRRGGWADGSWGVREKAGLPMAPRESLTD